MRVRSSGSRLVHSPYACEKFWLTASLIQDMHAKTTNIQATDLRFTKDNICVRRGTFVDVRSADDEQNVLRLTDSHSRHTWNLL